MLDEVRYFIEDYWKAILGVLGILILGFILYKTVIAPNGEEKAKEEVNELGFVTEDNYENKSEEARTYGQYLEESETNTNLRTGLIKEELKTYEKGDSFEYSKGFDVSQYEGNLDKVLEKYSEVTVKPEGDILRNKLSFDTVGNKIEGCYTSYDYYDCIERVKQEFKWGADIEENEELEDSFNNVGENIALQYGFLENMKGNSVKYDLKDYYKALDKELEIRSKIYILLEDLGKASQEESKNKLKDKAKDKKDKTKEDDKKGKDKTKENDSSLNNNNKDKVVKAEESKKEDKNSKDKSKEKDKDKDKDKDKEDSEPKVEKTKKELLEEEIKNVLDDLREHKIETENYWTQVEKYIVESESEE